MLPLSYWLGGFVEERIERVVQLSEFKGISIQFTLFIMSCPVIGPIAWFKWRDMNFLVWLIPVRSAQSRSRTMLFSRGALGILPRLRTTEYISRLFREDISLGLAENTVGVDGLNSTTVDARRALVYTALSRLQCSQRARQAYRRPIGP